MGQYFIKNKKIHKYPILDQHVEFKGEKIYGTPVEGYTKCKKCFGTLTSKDLFSE